MVSGNTSGAKAGAVHRVHGDGASQVVTSHLPRRDRGRKAASRTGDLIPVDRSKPVSYN